MLNFSTKGEYGLRAAVNLARSYPSIKSLKDISVEEVEESLELILQKDKVKEKIKEEVLSSQK